MPSDMFTGKTISEKAKKGKRLTRSQTAKQAASSIKKKYGSVAQTAKYYHRGNGEWAKYSPARDAKHKLKKPAQISPRYKKTKKAHKGDSNRRHKNGGRL